MKPKFRTALAWEQAQLLMQPAYIRVIDNLRKQLEQTSWKGTYQKIDTPYPGYQLSLSFRERSVQINIWDLCFQVCFLHYDPEQTHTSRAEETQDVEIDTSLFDETGDVDWQRLETKTQQLINSIFSKLPSN
ncbi:MAG: hypothetical protein ACFB4I_08715 [Cyanophyceae cyanobacterium]